MADPRHADPERGFRGLMAALRRPRRPADRRRERLAVGFGTTLLPWCDIAVAGESARFRVPFVSLGVTTEAASSVTLPSVMGPQAAARFVLTGDWLSADEALAAGLVSQVVPDDELLPTVHDAGRPHRGPAAERAAGDDPAAARRSHRGVAGGHRAGERRVRRARRRPGEPRRHRAVLHQVVTDDRYTAQDHAGTLPGSVDRR